MEIANRTILILAHITAQPSILEHTLTDNSIITLFILLFRLIGLFSGEHPLFVLYLLVIVILYLIVGVGLCIIIAVIGILSVVVDDWLVVTLNDIDLLVIVVVYYHIVAGIQVYYHIAVVYDIYHRHHCHWLLALVLACFFLLLLLGLLDLLHYIHHLLCPGCHQISHVHVVEE